MVLENWNLNWRISKRIPNSPPTNLGLSFGVVNILEDPEAVSGGGKKSKRGTRFDFLPPPLTAPGSPRMGGQLSGSISNLF